MDEGSGLVYSTIIINSVLGVVDRIFQILFYCKNKNDVKDLDKNQIVIQNLIKFF